MKGKVLSRLANHKHAAAWNNNSNNTQASIMPLDDEDDNVPVQTTASASSYTSYAGTKNAAIRMRMKERDQKVFQPRGGQTTEKFPALSIAVTMSHDENEESKSHGSSNDNDDDEVHKLDETEFRLKDYDDFSTTPLPLAAADRSSSFALMGRYTDDQELAAFQAYEQAATDDLLQTSLISLSSPHQLETPAKRNGRTSTTPGNTAATTTTTTTTTPHHLLQAWQHESVTPITTTRSAAPIIPQDSDSSCESLLQAHTNSSIDPTASSCESPFSTFKQNSKDIALEESKTYLVKITELQQALFQSRQETRRSQARVLELEQATARTTTATSSGSTIPETESLWERNKTLVREVRFADQTCVELSGQKTAMEEKMIGQQEELDHVRLERAKLYQELEDSRRIVVQVETKCDSLEHQCEKQAAQLESRRNERMAQNQRLQMELADTRHKLQEACSLLQEAKDALVTQGESAQSHIQGLEQRIEQAAVTATEELDAKQSEVESVRDASNAGRVQLTKRLQAAEQSSTDQVHVLTQQLQTLQQERATAELSYQESVEKAKSLGDQLHETQDELHAAQQGTKQQEHVWMQKLKAADDELDKAVEEYEAATAAIDSVQTELRVMEVKRDKAAIAAATANIELQETERKLKTTVQDTERKLQSVGAAYTGVKNELVQERARSTARLQAVMIAVQQQTRDWEERLNSETNGVASRLRQLSSAVSHMKENLELKEDSFAHSSMTGKLEDVTDSEANAPSEQLEALNATFNAGNDRSTDLELMEEARSQDSEHEEAEPDPPAAPQEDHVRTGSVVVTDTEAEDTLSSIGGISHLFEDEVSVSGLTAAEARAQVTLGARDASELAKAKIEIQELLAQNGEGEEQRDALRERVKQLQERVDTLDQKLLSSACNLEQVSSDKEGLLEQLETLELVKSDAEADLEATNAVLGDYEERIKDMEATSTAELEELSNECDALRENLGSVQNDKEEIESKLESELEAKVTTEELQRQIQSNSSALEQATSERDSLLEELQLAHREKQDVATELQAKSEALVLSKEICHKLDMLSSSFALEDASNERDTLKLEAELQAKRTALDDANLQIQDLEAVVVVELATERDALKERIQILQGEKVKLEDELDADFDHVARERDSYAAKVESLQSVRVELEAELEAKINALDAAMDQCDDYRSLSEKQSVSAENYKEEIDRIQEDLYNSEEELEQLQMAYIECNDKLASYESDNADTRALVEDYQETQQAAQDLALDAEGRFLDTRNSLESIRLEQATLQAKHDAVSEQLKERTQELNDFKSSMQLALGEKENAVQAAVVLKNDAVTNSYTLQNELASLQVELQTLKYAQNERGAAQAQLAETESERGLLRESLDRTNEQLSSIQNDFLTTRYGLQEKDAQVAELHAKKEQLESKCQRLRDYIRKLTTKCDQWEVFHEQQALVVEELRNATIRTRQKAREVALQYKQRGEMYSDERAMWSAERNNLTNIHSELEEELDEIARELSNVVLSPGPVS